MLWGGGTGGPTPFTPIATGFSSDGRKWAKIGVHVFYRKMNSEALCKVILGYNMCHQYCPDCFIRSGPGKVRQGNGGDSLVILGTP